MECTIKNIVDTSVSLAMLRLNLKWIIGGLTAGGNKWYSNRFVKTQHKQ